MLEFPRDRGSHPGHRIEWWYVTGHLATKDGARTGLGFQVTFFRVRNRDAESNPSRFSPSQLLFAHAAIADPSAGRLLHAQRSARMLQGLVEAGEGETRLRLDNWSLEREGTRYRARVADADFALELELEATQPPMLQGDRGFSRKAADPVYASYYYSEPQLRVTGRVTRKGKAADVEGVAWLDHEWSSTLLAPEAAGWDWIGANMDDGSALMVFRMRTRDGATAWAAGTRRSAGGVVETLPAESIVFAPGRTWRSPRTGVTYPVEMEVRAGGRRWTVAALLDDQELDARASTGTLYWEGAVRLSGEGGAGRGYLELTGYGERVPF